MKPWALLLLLAWGAMGHAQEAESGRLLTPVLTFEHNSFTRCTSNQAWADMDMEQLATFFNDTATFDWYDGLQYKGTDAFIERIMADTLDNEWEFRWAYSVDADTEKAGDWVQAGFEVESSKDSVLVEKAWYHEWYYIEDNQVQYWYNTKAVRAN